MRLIKTIWGILAVPSLLCCWLTQSIEPVIQYNIEFYMVIHGRYNASQLIYVETFFVLGSEFIVIKSISVMRGEVGNYTCIPYFRYIKLHCDL